MSNPTSTIDSFLMKKSGSSYAILVPIKEYPDLGSAPEGIDVTTLSDHIRKYVNGLQDVDTLEFTCNFDKDDYATVKALAGTETDLAVVFGANTSGEPDGHDGIFIFKGQPDVFVTGSGVNDAREMTVSVNLTSEITTATSLS